MSVYINMNVYGISMHLQFIRYMYKDWAARLVTLMFLYDVFRNALQLAYKWDISLRISKVKLDRSSLPSRIFLIIISHAIHNTLQLYLLSCHFTPSVSLLYSLIPTKDQMLNSPMPCWVSNLCLHNLFIMHKSIYSTFQVSGFILSFFTIIVYPHFSKPAPSMHTNVSVVCLLLIGRHRCWNLDEGWPTTY